MDKDVVENFYGCYVLVSTNPTERGCTYIGFTVDPERRVKQHNRHIKGGAKKTSRKGPWDMVLIIHGFPNHISALRFEWAWQNPKRSRRLRHLTGKRAKETKFQYCFRIASEMLSLGPWCRLPLTIRWLKPEYELQFSTTKLPPSHMPIVYGAVKSKKVSSTSSDVPLLDRIIGIDCDICDMFILDANERLQCLFKECHKTFHVTCLAKHFLPDDDFIVPLEGSCPSCERRLLWGELLRYQQGCYKNLLADDIEAS